MEIIPAEEEKAAEARRFESGRTLTATAMGTAFAAVLTIAGGQLQGELAGKAFYLLVASIPLFGVHYFSTVPGHERKYHASVLMKAMTVFGAVSLLLGLSMLIESARAGAGILFGVLSLACLIVCSQSEDRAKKLARRDAERAARAGSSGPKMAA